MVKASYYTHQHQNKNKRTNNNKQTRVGRRRPFLLCLLGGGGISIVLSLFRTTGYNYKYITTSSWWSRRVVLPNDDNGVVVSDQQAEASKVTLTPEQRACQQIPDSTEAFLHSLHDDLEHLSLRAWSNGNKGWSFPRFDGDLLRSAFENKSVAFVGDSTIFYIWENLNSLLNMSAHPDTKNYLAQISTEETTINNNNNKPQFLPLKDALDAIGRLVNVHEFQAGFSELYHANPEPAGNGVIVPYPGFNATTLWTGFTGQNMDDNCKFDQLVWPKLRAYRPQIVVATWGAHMFHHGPANRRPLCNVHQFLHYGDWLQSVLDTVQEINSVQLLLFKTVNRICPDRYPPYLKKGLALVYNNTNEFVQECVSHYQKQQEQDVLGKQTDFTQSELQHYCSKGYGSDATAQLLNEQMYEFVARHKKRAKANHNLTIEIYNDHDLERCEYTRDGDGTHYYTLRLPRIRLLSHMIHCLW